MERARLQTVQVAQAGFASDRGAAAAQARRMNAHTPNRHTAHDRRSERDLRVLESDNDKCAFWVSLAPH